MNNKILIEEGSYGKKASINTAWHNDFIKILNDSEIKELELNDGKGWSCNSLDFINNLPDLKALTIIDLKIENIEPIHFLKGLLKLEIITYCKTPLNFKSFPNLIECSLEWRRGSETLFELANLKTLFINNYDKKESNAFSSFSKLEDLSILNSKTVNLEGVSQLGELKKLRIANLKYLNDLKGLEYLKQLEVLEIQKCKSVNDVSPIFLINRLNHLSLIDLGVIRSLKGIDNLTDLSTLLFYESTNVEDGDLTPLFKLKKLKKISFQNRKHYSHKREEFGNLYL